LADGTFGRADERVVDWTIGPMIDVELPIFDWNQARVARAVHEWRQRRAEYDAARQRVNSQVRQTCVMVRQACQQVRFFREAILPEVQSNIELVRESYRAGGEEVTVLLQVQEDLIATRLTALGFVRDWLLSRAALERDAGGSLVLGAVAGMAPQSAAPAVE
jgi:outer membrane protein TolC